jgi:hypothetical protein
MEMKAKILLTGLVMLLSGCVTASGTTSESSARWKNAGIGAAIGCVATGPFCALGIGPVIGAVIGGVSSVDEKKDAEGEKLAPIVSSFGERQKNFYK